MAKPARKGKEPEAPQLRTLWRARLRFAGDGKAKEEFLFREQDDFSAAAVTAQQLLERSAAAHMAGAEIVAVERVAQLRN